jgi:hypothetical protein
MRAAVLAALVLVLAGCGGGASKTAAKFDVSAARLVPPDAKAFVEVDTHSHAAAWRAIAGLYEQQLDLNALRAAAGEVLDVAVLGDEAVAFAKPDDEAKLREVAARADYRVQKIGDWSVVADSQKAFDAVRAAQAGRSLDNADAAFGTAEHLKEGDALAWAFVRARGTWLTVRVRGDANALRLDGDTSALDLSQTTYRPTLLRDVPSGAIAAVSFKDLDKAKLPALPLLNVIPPLRGEGVLYVLETALVPTFVLEVQSPDPQAAEQALRATAAKLQARFGGVVALRVVRFGSRVVLTNAPASLHTGGGALVDDQPFKDALAAADVPQRVTWLAYADTQRLKPLLQLLNVDSQALDKLGQVIAFGTQSHFVVRASLR